MKRLKEIFLINDEDNKLFFIEKLGFFLILISGLMPFVHSFVKDEILENRFFGFTSYHTFLYSFGVHFGTILLTIGIVFVIAVLHNGERFIKIRKYLLYSLISPFISGVFYISWVFIPDVNYNLLAYIFLSLIICVICFIVFITILRYINSLNRISKEKKKSLNTNILKLTNFLILEVRKKYVKKQDRNEYAKDIIDVTKEIK